MRNNKWTEPTAIAAVTRAGVAVSGKYLGSDTRTGSCQGRGIRTWGAIDYLANHCGYTVIK